MDNTSKQKSPSVSKPTGESGSWRNRLHEVIFEADTPAGKTFDVLLLLAIYSLLLGTQKSSSN